MSNINKINKASYNSTINLVVYLVAVIAGIVKLKLVIFNYGNDFNSLYQFIAQMLSYMQLGNFGFTSLYLVYLYKSVVNQDKIEINKLLNGCKYFQKYSMIIMTVLTIIISVLIPFIVTKSSFNNIYIIFSFVILSIPVILEQYLNTNFIIYQAKQINYKAGGLYSLARAFSLFFCAFLTFRLDIKQYIVFEVMLNSIIIVFFINYTSKYNKKFVGFTSEIDKRPTKLSFKYFLVRLSNVIIFGTDNIMLARFVGLYSVGIVAPFVYISTVMTQIVSRLTAGIQNSLGIFLAEGNEGNGYAIKVIDLFLFFISLAICIPTYFGMNIFVSEFFYSSGGYTNVQYLDISLVLIIFTRTAFYKFDLVINGVGLYNYSFFEKLIEAILNICLSYILITSIGIAGVFIATSLSVVLISLPINNYIIKDYLHNSFLKTLLIDLTKIIVLLILLYFVSILRVNMDIYNLNLLITIFVILLFAIIFLIVLFIIFFLFSKTFKNIFYSILRRLQNKLK